MSAGGTGRGIAGVMEYRSCRSLVYLCDLRHVISARRDTTAYIYLHRMLWNGVLSMLT